VAKVDPITGLAPVPFLLTKEVPCSFGMIGIKMDALPGLAPGRICFANSWFGFFTLRAI
jgi:hypothetical protein